jgi:ketosteroid isomerase-like protein
MRDGFDTDQRAIEALIQETYAALSSQQPGAARFFAHPDIAIAGSGQGELVDGPEMAAGMAEAVSRLGYRWNPDEISIWVRGDLAWARIIGTVALPKEGTEELVPYWTTAVFERDQDGWGWRYWGGSEPQESPRV